MCESLPLHLPEPWRLGNEALCRYCQAGDCSRCTARYSATAWCEHPYCPWLPIFLPRPRRRTVMTDPVDDDPEYADEKVAHVDLPPLTDPSSIPADEKDEADQ